MRWMYRLGRERNAGSYLVSSLASFRTTKAWSFRRDR